MARRDVSIEEFLDQAGHELRIPITALKGHLQLMQRRYRGQPDHESERAEVDRLLFQTERLNYMLQVMLDAFHVSKGGMQLLPAEYDYDLAELVRRAVNSAAAANSDHQFRLEGIEDDVSEIPGNWDRLRVETVLSVVLSNAVKYSPPGEIEIGLARAGDIVRITVGDRGAGIPARERARVFRPYVHGSNVENPGIGLGLYVAREIVRTLGGEIGVLPRSGGGSTFWLTLPLRHYPTLSEQCEASAPEALPASKRAASRRKVAANGATPTGHSPQRAPTQTSSRTTAKTAPTRSQLADKGDGSTSGRRRQGHTGK